MELYCLDWQKAEPTHRYGDLQLNPMYRENKAILCTVELVSTEPRKCVLIIDHIVLIFNRLSCREVSLFQRLICTVNRLQKYKCVLIVIS